MKLLALVLLLSALPSLTLTEVVESFPRACSSFFMLNPQKQNDRIVPTIFTGHQYKKICQRWNDGNRFATVYDTVRRIPVYSAYTFKQQANTVRNEDWKIEPQLENIKGYEEKREMMDSPREAGNIINQAVNSDYVDRVINNIVYTRGHVFPREYAGDQDQADSTFTLTNIAPQSNANNGEWERQVETPMRNDIRVRCSLNQNPAYIVTGVVPGANWLNIKRNNKIIGNGINIPSHFWSAFCCKNNNGRLVSGAYIAEQGVFNLRRPSTIHNLNIRLTELYGQDFTVFPGSDC